MAARPKIKIHQRSAAAKRLKKTVFAKLREFNEKEVRKRAKGLIWNWKDLALEIRDSKGKLQAGLVGGMFWGWLYVELLWVDAAQRKSGLGVQLMKQAEKTAKQHGCRGAFLSTFSFQAPGFYRKLGYRSFGVLRNFPKGEQRIWMRKQLK